MANPDAEFTYKNSKMWRDILIGAGILVVGVFCPPAGIALGVAFGALELGTSVSGKDWGTGRKLDDSERALRGSFALIDIIPGAKAVSSFTKTIRASDTLLNVGQITKNSVKLGTNKMIAETAMNLKNTKNLVTSTVKNAEIRMKDVKKQLENLDKPNIKQQISKTKESVGHIVTEMTHLFNLEPNLAFAASGNGSAFKENTLTVRDTMIKFVEKINLGGGSKGTGKNSNKASEVKSILEGVVSPNSLKNQIVEVLRKHNLSLSDFQELKLKHVSELTSDEVRIMKEIRDSVPLITKDTLLQKTIPASDIEKYLSGEYAEIGGYIAKFEDVGHIKNYGDVVESFRLDYTSWNGSRPFPEDGDVYGKIKFTTNNVDNIEIPYGERFGGMNTDGPPCTQNGFTGSRNGEVVPEWQFDNRYLPTNGAELYRVTDGIEKLVAIFDSDSKMFIPVK